MILSAHQPNYFPWLGYFYKIAQSDIFVILDDVQFTKNSYQNRTQIKGPKEPLWLTQPVLQAGRALQRTDAVQFDTRVDWRDKHIKTLTANYSRAPHARELLPACREWLGSEGPSLAEMNIHLIRQIMRLLGLRTEVVLSSTLGIEETKADRLVELCLRLGARTYLSGHGARKYQDESQFHARDIELVYTGFTPTAYPQLWGEFCPGLSILDALFNIGAEATRRTLDDAAK